MNEVLIMPVTNEIEEKTEARVKEANQIIIADQTSYKAAADWLKVIVILKKEVEGTFADPKQKAAAAHKSICAAEKTHLEPLQKAEAIVKSKMSTWYAEQERKAREERLRLEAEQRKQDEERRLKEAVALESAGQKEEAEQVLAQEVTYAPIKIQVVEKVEGVSFRENWKWEIADQNIIPREYLMPDEKKINGLVRALKGETKISGIKVYAEKITSIRS